MISILSFNIYNQYENKETLLIEKLQNNNIFKLPDIILTQEHNKYFLDTSKSIYKEYFSFGSECEKVGLFILNCDNTNSNNDTTLKILSRIETNNHDTYITLNDILCPMCRYAFIVKYKGITIGNLHLEGGRYSDKQLPYSKHKLLLFKLKLLVELINSRPDIICGDFNSIHLDKHKSFTYKQIHMLFNQIQYMSTNIYNRKLSRKEIELIIMMNYLPYKLLKDAGYVYAKPNNYDNCITSSRGQSIVDTIWYLPNKVKCENSNIINCGEVDSKYLFGGLSDHNPIYANFTVI
jgi:exonuclease III